MTKTIRLKIMKHINIIVLTLVILGSVAQCEITENTILKAQIKMLEAKIRSQAAEIKALKQVKTPITKPAVKPADSVAKPTYVRGMLTYAFARAKIAEKEETTVRATKTINDARIKIQSMLAEGSITLTYQILNVDSTDDGNVRLAVGYPKETLATSGRVASTTKYRTFLIVMSNEQALMVSKGNKLIVRGEATLCNKADINYTSYRGGLQGFNSGGPSDGLVVLHHGAYRRQRNYATIFPGLFMRTFTFTLNGKEVESAEFVVHPVEVAKTKSKPTTRPITKVTVTYDKFKDNSVAKTKSVSAILHRVSLYYFFKGVKKPDHVKQVMMSVRRSGPSWEYLKYRPEEIIFIADGDKFAVQMHNYDSDVTDGVFHCSESMWFNLSMTQLHLLVKAKKIEAQLGTNAFDFSSVGIFADMVKYLGDDRT
jgi:hypothetical protein